MYFLLQKFLPKHLLTKCIKILANTKNVFIKNILIKYYIKLYPVNMKEATLQDPYAYETFNHFFIRKIRSELRPINKNSNSMVSPVDGCIYQVGYFNDRKVINVKGMDLIVTDLLGTKVNNNLFHHGAYINIYLSPADYHRVHMPIAGKLLQMAYIPGKLFSVNNHIAEAMPNLFTNNERVITIFQTKFGYMAIILVGAIFVGNIVTSWAGNINSDHKKQPFSIFYSTLPNKDVYLDMGQELGYFQMGSTVIVLLATEKVAWLINTTNNKNIKMGQQIGVIT